MPAITSRYKAEAHVPMLQDATTATDRLLILVQLDLAQYLLAHKVRLSAITADNLLVKMAQ